jgi:FlaG protein
MSGPLAHLPPARAADLRAGQASPPPATIGREPAPASSFRQGGPAAAPVARAERPDAVQQAVARVVEAYAPDRDVSVDSRYDRATGRAVVRVADRRTGEVLFESPPEELLRFFASARERPGAPLVVLEA